MAGFDDLELPPHATQNPDQPTSEDTNPSTNSDNIGNRQIKKRNRIPVSCNQCRRRKLKFPPLKYERSNSNRCDRKDPCTACVQRGDIDGCKFTEPLSIQPYYSPFSFCQILTGIANHDQRDLDRGTFYNNE